MRSNKIQKKKSNKNKTMPTTPSPLIYTYVLNMEEPRLEILLFELFQKFYFHF